MFFFTDDNMNGHSSAHHNTESVDNGVNNFNSNISEDHHLEISNLSYGHDPSTDMNAEDNENNPSPQNCTPLIAIDATTSNFFI